MTVRRHIVGRLFTVAVLVLVTAALVRTQSTGFQARRNELRRQAQAAQQAEGLAGAANRKALYAKYPTPEIALAKAPLAMKAGASAPLALTGRFAPGTELVVASEALTLSDVAVTAGGVKATMVSAADAPPQWARVYAFSPVSMAETWVPVFIGAPQAYSLEASNRWTVTLTPEAAVFTVSEREARVAYKAQFFKPGETAPFETTSGALALEASNTTPGSYTFFMQAGQAGSAMEEYQTLSKRMVELMQAGKVGTKEFAALQKQADALQERFTKEMEAMTADPAAMQKKQDDFGCGTINLSVRAGRVTGSITCGRNVGSLQVSGALR